jgi:hypothetical protein
MDNLVGANVASLGKRLATDVTIVRSLASVPSLVCLQQLVFKPN